MSLIFKYKMFVNITLFYFFTNFFCYKEEQLPKMEKFEKGMGIMLRNAWNHVEALQTTDLPALIQYISDILETSLEYPDISEKNAKSEDLGNRQEILIFYYLLGLMRHIDDIHEERYYTVFIINTNINSIILL